MFGGGSVVRDNQSCEMLNRESCWWAQTWSRDKPIFNHKRDPICFLLDELSLQRARRGEEEDQKDAAMVVGMQIHHRGGWVGGGSVHCWSRVGLGKKTIFLNPRNYYPLLVKDHHLLYQIRDSTPNSFCQLSRIGKNFTVKKWWTWCPLLIIQTKKLTT